MNFVRSVVDFGRLNWSRMRFSVGKQLRSVDPGNKHLALLAWALPPNTNAGVHRPLSLLRYAQQAGWRVSAFHGVAPDNQRQHGQELLSHLPPQIRLHEVADSALQPVWRWTPQIDGGFNHALAFAERAWQQLRFDPPSVILASGPPFMVFVAARWLANRLGVPYVLDYRDEWSECPFDFVSHGPDDRQWEARCVSEAAAVVFTTESHRQHQLSCFPQLSAERAWLIPNGWEAGDFQQCTVRARPSTKDFVLAHVGTLAGHTPPMAFLQSVEQLVEADPTWRKQLRLRFIGRRSAAAEAALRTFRYPEMLELVDHVSKKQAAQLMGDADALLLLANEDLTRYLPSKLFDYVAARRPVLVHGHRGEAATLVENLGVGLRCAPEEDLSSCLESLRTVSPVDDQVNAWLTAHRRDVLAKQFFVLFDKLTPSS